MKDVFKKLLKSMRKSLSFKMKIKAHRSPAKIKRLNNAI